MGAADVVPFCLAPQVLIRMRQFTCQQKLKQLGLLVRHATLSPLLVPSRILSF